MDTNSAEFFEEVSDQLKKILGPTSDVQTTFAGGGIICIAIQCGPYELWFGTANEDWGADVWKNDEWSGMSINTEKDIVGEPFADAAIIAEAVTEFERKRINGELAQ